MVEFCLSSIIFIIFDSFPLRLELGLYWELENYIFKLLTKLNFLSECFVPENFYFTYSTPKSKKVLRILLHQYTVLQ